MLILQYKDIQYYNIITYRKLCQKIFNQTLRKDRS